MSRPSEDAQPTPVLHVSVSSESESTNTRATTGGESEGDDREDGGGQPAGQTGGHTATQPDEKTPAASDTGNVSGNNAGGNVSPVAVSPTGQAATGPSAGSPSTGGPSSGSEPVASQSNRPPATPTQPASTENAGARETESDDQRAATPSPPSVAPAAEPAPHPAAAASAGPAIDQAQEPAVAPAPHAAATTATGAAAVERRPPVNAAPANHPLFGTVAIAAAGAATDVIVASITPAAPGAAEFVESSAEALVRAATVSATLPLPARAAYHFARVNAAPFCNGLDRFINECASLVPAAAPQLSSYHHRRAWAVTAVVVAADVALVGAHVRRRARRSTPALSDAPEPMAVPP